MNVKNLSKKQLDTNLVWRLAMGFACVFFLLALIILCVWGPPNFLNFLFAKDESCLSWWDTSALLMTGFLSILALVCLLYQRSSKKEDPKESEGDVKRHIYLYEVMKRQAIFMAVLLCICLLLIVVNIVISRKLSADNMTLYIILLWAISFIFILNDLLIILSDKNKEHGFKSHAWKTLWLADVPLFIFFLISFIFLMSQGKELDPEDMVHFVSGTNAGVLVLSNTVYSVLFIVPFK